MSKLITFAVPCYNSAAYMDHCVRTLLTGGDDIEIILVDDGSTKDDTPAICDRYQAEYPDIVRAIHQENGGHGEGVNQGLRHAQGMYYKVVDSDDWLDEAALKAVLDKLRAFAGAEQPLDLFIANYVYEHVEDNTQKVMKYTNVFPEGRVFTWNEIGRFRPSQYLLMHSVIYRTEMLRACRLELPKHTFYVDNIFVYQPLPAVKSIYYMDVDLYRYFIGRADQSVNEKVMVTRVDQQVRVTKLMIDSHNLKQLYQTQRKLARYMTSYLSMMMTISSIFLIIDGSPAALGKKTELWEYLRTSNPELYHKLKYRTEMLRACRLELPKHTFYVDNIFVYQPLPAVKSIYYMDVDLYRYFIGRADQSVNEKVMVTRVDQQVRVTKLMIDSHNLKQLYQTQRKLARYMTSYLSMMMTISSIFLIIDGSPAALGKKTELWEYLRTSNPELYHKLKYRSLSFVGNIPGYQGRKLSVKLYRLARKIYKFN